MKKNGKTNKTSTLLRFSFTNKCEHCIVGKLKSVMVKIKIERVPSIVIIPFLYIKTWRLPVVEFISSHTSK